MRRGRDSITAIHNLASEQLADVSRALTGNPRGAAPPANDEFRRAGNRGTVWDRAAPSATICSAKNDGLDKSNKEGRTRWQAETESSAQQEGRSREWPRTRWADHMPLRVFQPRGPPAPL